MKIASVFSGMARAIIHNSDYQSVEEFAQLSTIYRAPLFSLKSHTTIRDQNKGCNKYLTLR